MRKQVRDFVLTYSYQLLIFASFLAIYLFTLYPGEGGRINFGDSIKWQYLHLANGLPHGTGYPQFLLLTEVFSRLVFFLDSPERISFISVVFGALSLTLFYSLLQLLTKDKLGSLLATLLVGVSYTFWAQATEAEVYTLNVFYILAVFYLFIQFFLTKESKYYLLGCAVYALSFGNHLTMITLLPAIAFIALVTDHKIVFSRRNLALVVLFVLIGMSQYGFILYRAHGAPPLYSEVTTHPSVAEFLGYITGNHKAQMFVFGLNDIIFDRFPVLLRFLNENFTVAGLLLAAAGFFYYLYVKRAYVITGFISLALLGQLVFNISYDVADLVVFFLPVYVIVGIFVGLLFAAQRDTLPKVVLSLLILFLVNYNTGTRDIFAKNEYAQRFSPILSLYQQQPDSLPLFYRAKDYNMHTYLLYIGLSGALGDAKLIFPEKKYLVADSFYVASEADYYEELATDYDLKLVAEEQLHDFIHKQDKNQNVLFLSVTDEAAQNMPKEVSILLKPFGSMIEQLPVRASFAAVLHKNSMVEVMNATGPAVLTSKALPPHLLSAKLDFEIFSGGWEFGNKSEFIINGNSYSGTGRGVNIIVYNLARQKVTAAANFDTHSGTPLRLFKAIKKQPLLLSSVQ